jgi:Protein kinase domain/WD40-like Beta Propeller Repeat
MSPQSCIAHYRVTSKLGEGGMGEVWRATDTKLGRDVAIKVLPEAFAQDGDRMARFTREAQVLASLNHPNIAAIYGVEERALVMELVEGPTVAERIAQGPIPLDEALPIAKQIAEALEYAHERGVIHRDLKPANLKITPEGRVKVLDFGLAKALGQEAQAEASATVSPTLTMRATQLGVILGTAAYMSPEQAKGKTVDKRADIWAFGVVVCEMLTGRQMYTGETISETLAAVLLKDPDLSALPAETPASIRRLLRRCLDKDPQRRLRDIGEARIAIEAPIEEVAQASPPALDRPGGRSYWAAAILAAALLVLAFLLWHATRPVERPLTRLNVDLGPDALAGLSTTVAISPDGRRLVYPARGPNGKQQLTTRLLDQAHAMLLPGTEGGRDPFFKPDGQWIGFFADNKLKKISVQGGALVTLCDVTNPQGGSWGEDGNIVFAPSNLSALSRVSEAGGAPERLTKLTAGQVTHRWPQVLPGGQAVLFTAIPTIFAMEDANIEAMVLKTGATKVVHRGGYYGRYLPSGHLLYVHERVLFGMKFDPERLEASGTPVPLVEDLAATPGTGGGQFDFSRASVAAGDLVYLSGKGTAQGWPLEWLDSSGKTQPLLAAPGGYTSPHLSPEGQRLALMIAGKGTDIFVYDWRRGGAMTQLTFDGHSGLCVWAPDGKHIAYRSSAGGFSIWWMRSDGSGERVRLLENPNDNLVPWSFSPDGRRLAYAEVNPDTGFDLWTLPLDTTDPDHPKAGKPEPFLRTSDDENCPAFSPDGRWIAYRSSESGSYAIYVRPFPPAASKWRVSAGPGTYAFWSKTGHELFYTTPDNRIMVAEYTASGDSFALTKPPRLWSDHQIFNPGTRNMDLAPDGKRFAVLASPENAGIEKESVHVVFLQNFFDELRRRIPAK